MTQHPASRFDGGISVKSIGTTPDRLVSALTILLTSVCTNTEWEYGESWLPNSTGTLLELSPAWCVNTNLDLHKAISWMQFQICSRAFVLSLGEGLPGRVWQHQQCEWLEDATAASDTYFLRNQIAKAFSVKTGFGIPIIVGAQVLAVVVFFRSKSRSPHPLTIAQTQAIVSNFQFEYSRWDTPIDSIE
ncbi:MULTISPECIES: GAF domain-containing protein [unclassified Chamaesiphon]|uniref:GAF domain-containing protein n=1 Tax=unclassified Chamaesiphon TaxID=2620921 RepID=UPI00286AD179|nr:MULTISPECIES: GAF domain-containing protein [unclassified Chamaesiphon]